MGVHLVGPGALREGKSSEGSAPIPAACGRRPWNQGCTPPGSIPPVRARRSTKPCDRLPPGRHGDLAEQMMPVALDRGDLDPQAMGDLLVAPTVGHQPEHLELLRGAADLPVPGPTLGRPAPYVSN